MLQKTRASASDVSCAWASVTLLSCQRTTSRKTKLWSVFTQAHDRSNCILLPKEPSIPRRFRVSRRQSVSPPPSVSSFAEKMCKRSLMRACSVGPSWYLFPTLGLCRPKGFDSQINNHPHQRPPKSCELQDAMCAQGVGAGGLQKVRRRTRSNSDIKL